MTAITIVSPRNRPNAGYRLTGRAWVDWILVVWGNWPLFNALVRRDISARYRGSLLGIAWLVGIPLAMMATYTFVFSAVFKVRFGDGGAGETALAIWLGTLLWQVVGETWGRSAIVLHDNSPYVKRIPFPIALLPLLPLGSAAVGAAVSLGLLALAHLFVIGMPPASWLLAAPILLSLVLLTAGGAWMLASVGAMLRDLKHVVPMAMTLVMFVTPVLYPLSSVPPRLSSIVQCNPFAWIFESARAAIVLGQTPSMTQVALQLGGATVFAALGYALFSAREWEYADHV